MNETVRRVEFMMYNCKSHEFHRDRDNKKSFLCTIRKVSHFKNIFSDQKYQNHKPSKPPNMKKKIPMKDH